MGTVTRFQARAGLAVMSLATVVAAASGGAARSGAPASPTISRAPHAGRFGSPVAIRGAVSLHTR